MPGLRRKAFRRIATIGLYVIPLVAVLVSPITGQSIYWVNDDVGNAIWLSGAESGSPEFRSPVIGPVFGGLVSTLYRISAVVPWYPVVLLSFPTIVLWRILGQLKTTHKAAPRLTFSLLISCFLYVLGRFPNYTFSAFLSISLSILLLKLRFFSNHVRLRNLLTPLLLCSFAISIRSGQTRLGIPVPEVFAVCAAVSLLVVFLGFERFGFARKFQFVGLLAIVFLVSAVAGVVSSSQSAEWREFIDFYSLRGKLNGSKLVDFYLDENSYLTIRNQSGMSAFSIAELGEFELFDIDHVTNDDLRALHEEASRFWPFSPFKFEGLLQIVLAAGRFSIFTGVIPFLFLLAIQTLNQSKWVRHNFRALAVIVFASLFTVVLAGFVSSSIRLPNYVRLGLIAVLTIQLFGGLHMLQSPRQPVPGMKRRWKSLTWGLTVLAATACLSSFVGDERPDRLVPDKSSSNRIRNLYRQSSAASHPVLVGAGVPGAAFQRFPFDARALQEYRESKLFSGGSNIRSPQSLARWNRVSGRSDLLNEAFNYNFYFRVVMDLSKAVNVANGLLEGNRLPPQIKRCPTAETIPKSVWARLVWTECSQAQAFGSIVSVSSEHDQSLLWTGGEGVTIKVFPRIPSALSIRLVPPFGPYSTSHAVLVEVFDEFERSQRFLRRVVPGRLHYDLELPIVSFGTSIRVRSISDCVTPYELNPVFLDRRTLCVGITSLELDGVAIPIKEILVD